MHPKLFCLGLALSFITSSISYGSEIAISGGSTRGTEISIVELESIAREECRKLSHHTVLDEHDMNEQTASTKPWSRKRDLRKLQVDYLILLHLKVKKERMYFMLNLFETEEGALVASTNLSFDLNELQLRRMIRICLRDLLNYFYEIQNPIVIQTKK